MIKTNLIKRESAGSYQAGKLLIPALGVPSIKQILLKAAIKLIS
jgi:hypothetical protein